MTVKRYDATGHDFDIEEDISGDFVCYEDYEALENDYNILRRDYETMMQRLKDIWVEG